ncbi:MAG: branched-chain amino acid ABC transporter permease [Pseudomonadota bacterium]|jgi:branched-chain amino acid transport system permease protein
MNLLASQLADGIADGAIYASLALALVFSYRSTSIVNFAQGEMAMLSAFTAWQLMAWGLGLFAAASISIGLSFVFGAVLYFCIVRPLSKANLLTVVSVLIGLYLALNSLAGFIWTYTIKPFPSFFPSGHVKLGFFNVAYETAGIVIVISAVLLVLYVLFEKTKIGLAMRGAASAPDSSVLVGVSVPVMLMIGWGIAAALGALSGILVAPRVFLNPTMMFGIIIYAFAAATLGGFDSMIGAIVGGLLVGVIENLVGTYVPWIGADLKVIVALVLIFATLLIKPDGLFGRRKVVRL